MTDAGNLADWQWLVDHDGQSWLRRAADHAGSLLSLAEMLRQDLSSDQTRLVLQQLELRRRGREKFSAADKMFFTRTALEQASDETVAAYKAGRFPADVSVADLCCGIGGDLFALASRGAVTGMDLDPVKSLLAEANVRAVSPEADVHVEVSDVASRSISEFAAWHLDPDRRAAGRRATRVDLYTPGLEVIESLRGRWPQGAVKLAPATVAPESWQPEAELEWISRDGECRQQVAWFGSLTQWPGRRSATVLTRGAPPRTISGEAAEHAEPALTLGRYLFDVDAAVLAAGLSGALAAVHGLGAVSAGNVYLTGDRAVADAALSTFEICDVLPFDLKKLRGLFRQRGIGRLEVKKRGVPHDPEELRRKLVARGDASATLIVSRLGERVVAIVARRLPHP